MQYILMTFNRCITTNRGIDLSQILTNTSISSHIFAEFRDFKSTNLLDCRSSSGIQIDSNEP